MNTVRYRLYARPSFLEGLARLWDWSGSLNVYNAAPDNATADAWALGEDWRTVGDDMRAALRAYKASVS